MIVVPSVAPHTAALFCSSRRKSCSPGLRQSLEQGPLQPDHLSSAVLSVGRSAREGGCFLPLFRHCNYCFTIECLNNSLQILWEPAKVSPPGIGYSALSVVVGVRAGACPDPRSCSPAVQFARAPTCPRSTARNDPGGSCRRGRHGLTASRKSEEGLVLGVLARVLARRAW